MSSLENFKISSFQLVTIIWLLWLGAFMGTGMLVAPVLFAQLDSSLAGDLVGQLLPLLSMIGIIVCVLCAVISYWQFPHSKRRRWVIILSISIIILLLVNELSLHPLISELRALRQVSPNPQLTSQFRWLHSLSMLIFILVSLLGLVKAHLMFKKVR